MKEFEEQFLTTLSTESEGVLKDLKLAENEKFLLNKGK